MRATAISRRGGPRKSPTPKRPSRNEFAMRILVTFAVKAEFGPWNSRHAFVPYEFENWERARDFDLFKANLDGNQISVLLTGMGGENAQAAMRSVPVESYEACISTGLAGALDR